MARQFTFADRTIIEARWNDGDSYTEIARKLSCSSTAVRAEIARHSPDGLRYSAAEAQAQARRTRGRRRIGVPE